MTEIIYATHHELPPDSLLRWSPEGLDTLRALDPKPDLLIIDNLCPNYIVASQSFFENLIIPLPSRIGLTSYHALAGDPLIDQDFYLDPVLNNEEIEAASAEISGRLTVEFDPHIIPSTVLALLSPFAPDIIKRRNHSRRDFLYKSLVGSLAAGINFIGQSAIKNGIKANIQYRINMGDRNRLQEIQNIFPGLEIFYDYVIGRNAILIQKEIEYRNIYGQDKHTAILLGNGHNVNVGDLYNDERRAKEIGDYFNMMIDVLKKIRPDLTKESMLSIINYMSKYDILKVKEVGGKVDTELIQTYYSQFVLESIFKYSKHLIK